MIVIPLILLVVAICVAVVAGLAWTAKLPGNSWVGIRAPEARKSQENWDITHRVAGPPWAVAAIAFLGSALLAFLAIKPEASGWLWLWVIVAVLGGLAMIGVGGAMGAHTIALYDAKVNQESNEGGCSCSADSSDCADSANPASDCGQAGGCASCGLNGMCTSDHAPKVDLEALRRAAEKK